MRSVDAAAPSDWYVDALNGNDLNNGSTSPTAWRTISHAIATATSNGSSVETIHVAPGTYDSALGEVFPIVVHPRQQLLGAGAAMSVLDGGGLSAELLHMESNSFNSGNWDNTTLVRDLTLRNARNGLYVYSTWSVLSPTVEDVVVENMSGAGLKFWGGVFQTAGGSAEGTYRRVVARNNLCGAELNAAGTQVPLHSAATNPLFEDCVFEQNTQHGALMFSYTPAGFTKATFRRCQLSRNSQSGLRCVYTQSMYSGNVTVTLESCSISNNGGDGYDGQAGSPQSSYGGVIGTLRRCTIANNVGIGVRAFETNPGQNHATALEGCIVYGNGDDIYQSGVVTAKYGDVEDGDFAGSNGNFSADPKFVNAAAGDYRLSVDSPCVDTGDPAAPLDPDCSRSDVGAFPRAAPQVYCTAKVNSCGGTPAIGWSGASSASSGAAFLVRATGAKALKPGLLLYGDQGIAAVPFSGGTLCVAMPVRRSTAVVDSVGTPGACDGILQIDVNGFAHGNFGGSPAPSLLVAGTRFHCQFWGRDTPTEALLSDALEFVVCP